MIEGFIGRPGEGKTLEMTRRVVRAQCPPPPPSRLKSSVVVTGLSGALYAAHNASVPYVGTTPGVWIATLWVSLVALMLFTRKQRPPKYAKVFANYTMDVPGWEYLEGPGDLLRIVEETSAAPDGTLFLIVIDEIQNWFDSRASLKLPASMRRQLSQTRKARWSMMWSSQHESNVDKRIRNLANWLYECRVWPRDETVLRSMLSPSRPLFTRVSRYEPALFNGRISPSKKIRKKSRNARVIRLFPMAAARRYDTFEVVMEAEHVREEADVYRKAA